MRSSPSKLRLQLERAKQLDRAVKQVQDATEEQASSVSLAVKEPKIRNISSTFVTKVLAEAIVQLPTPNDIDSMKGKK